MHLFIVTMSVLSSSLYCPVWLSSLWLCEDYIHVGIFVLGWKNCTVLSRKAISLRPAKLSPSLVYSWELSEQVCLLKGNYGIFLNMDPLFVFMWLIGTAFVKTGPVLSKLGLLLQVSDNIMEIISIEIDLFCLATKLPWEKQQL